MPPQPTTSHLHTSGTRPLERHEVTLLEQMTAEFDECPDCGTDGQFVASWTPWETVHRIVCATCLHTFWAAP